jgi:hypothetical protein
MRWIISLPQHDADSACPRSWVKSYHPEAKNYLERRRAAGDNKAESIRALKRRLSDVVFKALTTDAEANTAPTTAAA